ncbi:MAG: hypothetical protein G01um101418_208 [Parcubacteria group bacterium Gr01-1014_18]|nr:MAG: hypothetical protein Greene041636_176 [Parcubacteria group bacterium Greene0416_36]TSC81368.1 MAG: hypothetical protein G01um101418_208 [Parcubacteria group bacterium Gr01-1014_18]TSC99446.1 MAG: hypothetical protein Greene101420_113 [Parcubacteria group bacterium Greene1014_20]TSD07635.1 MAG: hypothetical protein Greene07142_92 [Parcubacteria group bacterium Greene0714_2]
MRLVGYDYSKPGFYFVTVLTKDRECLFGEIEEGEMRLGEMGKIAEGECLKTSEIRKNIKVDCFVVMPNHVHGIIEIMDVDGDPGKDNVLESRPGKGTVLESLPGKGVLQYALTSSRVGFRSPSNNLGAVIRGYKSSVTKQINDLRNTPCNPVWHRNYHDHIIRSLEELENIREYIKNNPRRWKDDPENV